MKELFVYEALSFLAVFGLLRLLSAAKKVLRKYA